MNLSIKDIKIFLFTLLTLVVGLAIIVGVVLGLYYLITIRPVEERLAHKIAWRKKILSEIAATKKRIKYNEKQGRQNYMLFKKYHSELYLYHHNKIATSYLKKAAYDGYPKAEYKYVVLIWAKSIYSKNKNYILYSQISRYAKSIALMQSAAKQNYKQAIFQIALLCLYGANPVVHYKKSEGFYDKITLSFKNKKKAKKILYELAGNRYKPAMKMVNKLFNK